MVMVLGRRLGVLSAGERGRRVLMVAAVALACGAGGAAAQSGPSGALTAHLYWANNGGKIVEANLNGTGAKTIVKGQKHKFGVAVGGGHLYWTNAYGRGHGTIFEAKLNGTGATTIVKGQDFPEGVAVGPYRDHGAGEGGRFRPRQQLDHPRSQTSDHQTDARQ